MTYAHEHPDICITFTCQPRYLSAVQGMCIRATSWTVPSHPLMPMFCAVPKMVRGFNLTRLLSGHTEDAWQLYAAKGLHSRSAPLAGAYLLLQPLGMNAFFATAGHDFGGQQSVNLAPHNCKWSKQQPGQRSTHAQC